MVNWQTDPAGLYIDPDAPDGAYLVYKSGIRFSEFLLLVDGTGTTVTVDSGAGEVSVDVASSTAEPVVTVVGGVPGLLFDNDGKIVKREVSP